MMKWTAGAEGGTERRERPGAAGVAAALALPVLYAFTAVGLAGYAVYGVNPARLIGLPEAALAFYARSFTLFAQGQVWLAGAALALVLTLHAGARWLLPLAALYGVSLASELAGTTWGLPFGAYEYGPLLGVRWLDRVPVVVPLSWFCMALPSYALAARVVSGGAARVLLASLGLLAWDLTLDPAMSFATPYWQWADTGPYYGMPWLNLFGWYVTGLLLMGALAAFRVEAWTERIAPRWWAGYYGANLLMPLGMCVAAGLWAAVGATAVVLAALAAPLALALLREAPEPGPEWAPEVAR